jgi:hypothetical protein
MYLLLFMCIRGIYFIPELSKVCYWLFHNTIPASVVRYLASIGWLHYVLNTVLLTFMRLMFPFA